MLFSVKSPGQTGAGTGILTASLLSPLAVLPGSAADKKGIDSHPQKPMRLGMQVPLLTFLVNMDRIRWEAVSGNHLK